MKKREAQNEKLMYEIAQVGLAVIHAGLRGRPQLRHSPWGYSYVLLRCSDNGSFLVVG